METIKRFLIGIILLAAILVSLVVVVLTYNANEQSSVRSYIFQMDNRASMRIGPLQNLKTMQPEELRNKLIQKYVAEYFKVIPGTIRPEQNQTIRDLSTKNVYKKWQDGEAKSIDVMSKDKMFRNVWVDKDAVQQIRNTQWFAVPYTTRTWTESNKMNAQVIDEAGIINLKIEFDVGLRPKINVRKTLEKGDNPAGLFKFRVIDVK